MKGRTRACVFALALLPAFVPGLAACSAPAANEPSPAPAAQSPVGDPSSSGTGSRAGDAPLAEQPAGPAGAGAPPVPDAPVVQWVPISPIGPNDPQEGRMYLFAQGWDCGNLRDGIDGTEFKDVWEAATAACFAVEENTQQRWQEADAAVAALQAVPAQRCLERTVVAAVSGVVSFHKSRPAQKLPLEPGVGEACPRQLTGLTVVDEQLRPVPGLSSPSGSRSGGALVRLDGYYVRVSEILIDGVNEGVQAEGTDYGPFYFRTPPANGRDSITVSIIDTLAVRGTAVFRYDPEPSTSGGTSGTAPSDGGQPGGGQPGVQPTGTGTGATAGTGGAAGSNR